jgi:hypothetical protein
MNAFDPSANGGPDAYAAKLDLITPVATQSVGVDVKPGTSQNTINPRSKGVIQAAVLSDPDFDATTIQTACFGDAEDPAQRDCSDKNNGTVMAFRPKDVDHDGDIDALFHFDTEETGIDPGDTQACVHGTATGGPYQGCDSIRTTGKG